MEALKFALCYAAEPTTTEDTHNRPMTRVPSFELAHDRKAAASTCPPARWTLMDAASVAGIESPHCVFCEFSVGNDSHAYSMIYEGKLPT